jgi:hypothetical protein
MRLLARNAYGEPIVPARIHDNHASTFSVALSNILTHAYLNAVAAPFVMRRRRNKALRIVLSYHYRANIVSPHTPSQRSSQVHLDSIT